MIDATIKVDDIAFAYLKVQKGKLDAFAHNKKAWVTAYEKYLWTQYEEMKPYLPYPCWGILDVGSGLGGIDILLYRHYYDYYEHAPGDWGKCGPYINLLDGENDKPEMILHRKTFNNMAVAKDFLTTNGVPRARFHYYTPDAVSAEFVKPYDLIVSMGSWGFHYAPDVYLPRLVRAGGLHTNTVVILDVRKDKPVWSQQLNSVLAAQAVVRDSEKYLRTVFAVR